MWCPWCQNVVNTKGEDKQDPGVPDAVYTIYNCPECHNFLAMAKVDKQGNVKAVGNGKE